MNGSFLRKASKRFWRLRRSHHCLIRVIGLKVIVVSPWSRLLLLCLGGRRQGGRVYDCQIVVVRISHERVDY